MFVVSSCHSCLETFSASCHVFWCYLHSLYFVYMTVLYSPLCFLLYLVLNVAEAMNVCSILLMKCTFGFMTWHMFCSLLFICCPSAQSCFALSVFLFFSLLGLGWSSMFILTQDCYVHPPSVPIDLHFKQMKFIQEDTKEDTSQST